MDGVPRDTTIFRAERVVRYRMCDYLFSFVWTSRGGEDPLYFWV